MRRPAALVTRVAAWMSRWRSTAARDDVSIETLLDPGFVAIDLETTGLDPRRDDVVSIAAVPFVAGRPEPGYVMLVDPGRPIPPASTRIHGIDDVRVAGAPRSRRAPRVRRDVRPSRAGGARHRVRHVGAGPRAPKARAARAGRHSSRHPPARRRPPPILAPAGRAGDDRHPARYPRRRASYRGW